MSIKMDIYCSIIHIKKSGMRVLLDNRNNARINRDDRNNEWLYS